MRQDCKYFETRTYANGDAMRRCALDLAPEAPWRCPADCARYQRRTIDVAWERGSLVAPPTPPEPPGVGEGEGVGALLDLAEEIVNAASDDAVRTVEEERRRAAPRWRRLVARLPRPRLRRR